MNGAQEFVGSDHPTNALRPHGSRSPKSPAAHIRHQLSHSHRQRTRPQLHGQRRGPGEGNRGCRGPRSRCHRIPRSPPARTPAKLSRISFSARAIAHSRHASRHRTASKASIYSFHPSAIARWRRIAASFSSRRSSTSAKSSASMRSPSKLAEMPRSGQTPPRSPPARRPRAASPTPSSCRASAPNPISYEAGYAASSRPSR